MILRVWVTVSMACAASAWAQAAPSSSIRVGDNVHVSDAMASAIFVEPYLAIAPGDGRRLVAIAIMVAADSTWSSKAACVAFTSADGGRQWRPHRFDVEECGDPWAAMTRGGNVAVSMLGRHAAVEGGRFGVLVFHSGDEGQSWNDRPTAFRGGHDHPTLLAENSAFSSRGMYLLSGRAVRRAENVIRFSVFVVRSRDGGRTFDAPVEVVPSNLNLNAQTAVALADGTLIVAFKDIQRNVDGFRRAGLLSRPRAWVLVSRDSGRTFSEPAFASEQCGLGWVTLAADLTSGPYRNRIYLVCQQSPENRVVLHYSADHGETWSDAVPVRQAPDSIRERMAPMVAVNDSGVIGIAWVDRRVDSASNCYQVLFTASLDGGDSFLPAVRVSSVPSCPVSSSNGPAVARWPEGGDYFGLAAAPDGRFHILWAGGRSGALQLWTSAVDVDGVVRSRQ